MKNIKILFFGFLIISTAYLACLPFGDKDDDLKIDLPTIIVDFIANEYPDYKIDEAEKEVACTGSEVYEVELEANNDDELELTFDLEGNLLYMESEIKKEELPEAILATINSDYPDYKLKEAERLDLTTDGVQYEVELKKDKIELEVLFTAAGTVICEQEDE